MHLANCLNRMSPTGSSNEACLLAHADGTRGNSPAAAVSQRRVLYHPAAIAEDRSADQGDCQPDQTGLRCQLPRRRLVPRLVWRVDSAPNVSGGTSVPVESHLINLQRLTDTL